MNGYHKILIGKYGIGPFYELDQYQKLIKYQMNKNPKKLDIILDKTDFDLIIKMYKENPGNGLLKIVTKIFDKNFPQNIKTRKSLEHELKNSMADEELRIYNKFYSEDTFK
jgi:hypothetical protein